MRSLPRIWILLCIIGLSAFGLVAASAASGASTSAGRPSAAHSSAAAAKAPKSVEVYATYYGWFDNTPPGCATAYSG